MSEFLISAALNALLATGIIFGTGYLATTVSLFGATHGAIVEWRTRLAKMRVRLAKERCQLNDDHALLVATATPQECESLELFVAQHVIVERVDRRLTTLRRAYTFFALSVLLGLGIGTVIASPILFGQPSVTQQLPFLVPVVSVLPTAVMLLIYYLPHVMWWNDLKNLTPE